MDEVIDLLQQLMQQAGELADELSDEEMAEILRIFQEAIELIEAGNAQAISAQGPSEIPSGPFESSNVNGFKYDPDTGELQVQFHGPYPQAEGDIYSYEGVPKYIYDVFSRGAVGPKTSGKNRYHEWNKGVTPSLGAALNALIKAGGFPYKKL